MSARFSGNKSINLVNRQGWQAACVSLGRTALLLLTLALLPTGAHAASPVSCAGAVMMGGAQLMCTHLDPTAPPQFCTFSWALATTANVTQVVDGSFLLPPGASNMQIYQGSGFSTALSQPIVMCQNKAPDK